MSTPPRQFDEDGFEIQPGDDPDIESSYYGYEDFDRTLWGGQRQKSKKIRSKRDLLNPVDSAGRALRIGDRIKVNNTSEDTSSVLLGLKGKIVIIHSEQQNVGIEFDTTISGLHDCGGHAKEQHGYYVYDFDLSKDEFIQKNWNQTSWQGYEYYRAPKLSYRYIQQTANALAAQYKINVKIDNTWNVDTESRTLTYNPISLMYGTKAELLGCLLRAIGKLRYTASRKTLTSPFLKKYEQAAYNVMLDFEEFRTNELIAHEYPTAIEIFQSQKPIREEEIIVLLDISKKYSKVVAQQLSKESNVVEAMLLLTFGKTSNKMGQKEFEEYNAKIKGTEKIDGDEVSYEDPRHSTFKMVADITKKMSTVKEKFTNSEVGNIFDYLASLIARAYDIDIKSLGRYSIPKNIEDMVTATLPYTLAAKNTKSTEELIAMMDGSVYPVIEELLKNFKEGEKAIKDAFGEAMAKIITEYAQESSGAKEMMNAKELGSGSGPTEQHLPPEWQSGDYRQLKESVLSEIRSLQRKLRKIRRQEATARMIRNQRRGLLDTKNLHKYRMGNMRVFKRKLPSIDTISSFAFSIVIDISGSMEGERIVHTVRSMIILSEVFDDMGIPFEIIPFGSDARVLKSFDQPLGEKIKTHIGGLVNKLDGGTNLDRGLEKVGLSQREEKNKILVILSDGGVGDPTALDEQYFSKFNKEGIKTIPIGLECGDEIEALCFHTGKQVDNAANLPEIFYTMLRGLVEGARIKK